MIAAMVMGCGSKEIPTKEFTAADGSCTIQLNEKWVEEDTGMDNWIAAFNELGTEGAMVMQFTKGVMDANVSGIPDIRNIVEESYVMTDMAAIDVESSVLSNVEAYPFAPTCFYNLITLSWYNIIFCDKMDIQT